jgi:hypothetical protein
MRTELDSKVISCQLTGPRFETLPLMQKDKSEIVLQDVYTCSCHTDPTGSIGLIHSVTPLERHF